MHRSGTSCLAGSLERCALHLGEVIRQSRFNAKGNHELKAAMDLHNQILKASGGSWDEPPARITLDRRHKQDLGALARELCQRRPCGLKDPRLLLLLEEWLPVVEPIAGGYTMVGTFRHPAATANSLAVRNQFPLEKSLRLWCQYNERLVAWHRRCGFPLLEFDLALAEPYLRAVVQVAGQLGLEPDLDRLTEFITAELDHRPTELGEVPPVCRPIFDYLHQHRLGPDGRPNQGINT